MVKVRVSELVSAERHLVWSELARIEDHVEWMQDATAIRFLGATRSGVGTRFECATKVGPVRLTDVMEITEWENSEALGVRHNGVVSGSGRFTLTDAAGAATLVGMGGAARLSVVVGVDARGAAGQARLHCIVERKPAPLGSSHHNRRRRSRCDPVTRRTRLPGKERV